MLSLIIPYASGQNTKGKARKEGREKWKRKKELEHGEGEHLQNPQPYLQEKWLMLSSFSPSS